MSHLIAKKQEEWNSQKVRELLRLPENKKCFDCPTKSPFFVNVSIKTFLCTRCSGLVREVGHRVKSISASKFSGPEIVALQYGGNAIAKSIWLSTYKNMTNSEPETDGDVRLFMRQKYYEQKWLDRKKGIEHAENVKKIIKELYSEDGSRKAGTLGRNGSISENKRASVDMNNSRPKIVPTQSWVDDNVPIGLIPAVQQQQQQGKTMDDLLLNDGFILSSPKSPQFPSIPQPSISNHSIVSPTSPSMSNINSPITPATPTLNKLPNIISPTSPINNNKPKPINDIFGELASLAPSTLTTASPTYSGGILQPNSPLTPSSATNTFNITPIQASSPIQQQQQPKPTTPTNKFADLDPYAALRDLSIGSKKPVTQPPQNSLNALKIKTSSDDSMSWGDFQKSPTTQSFNSNTNKSTMFSDLDPLFNIR